MPHRHRHRGLKNYQLTTTSSSSSSSSTTTTTTCDDEPEQKRPKVNPIFLWASQHDQKIVEVRCEDYDKRNRIKLTKTPQGWRSIPRTASNNYAGRSFDIKDSSSEKENGDKDDQLRRLANGDLDEFGIKDRLSDNWIIANEEREKLVRLHSKMRIQEVLPDEKIRMLQEKIQHHHEEEEVRKRQEEKVRMLQEEMDKLENLRKLEEIMINGKTEAGQVELKNRSAIRKRSEIRRNDELRKKEKEIAEQEQRRKRQEIQKKMQRRKLEELELQKKVRHRKRKKEHVVLGYSTTDGINAWKLRKRRNPKQKRKRRSVSGVCSSNTLNSISTINGINVVNDVSISNTVNTANRVCTINTIDSKVHTINNDPKIRSINNNPKICSINTDNENHSINTASKVQTINTDNDNTINNDTDNDTNIYKAKTISRSANTDRNSSNRSTISNRLSINNRNSGNSICNRNTISSTNNRISGNRGISPISEEVSTKKPKTQKGSNPSKQIDFDHLMQPRVVLEQLQLTEMEDGQHYKKTSKNPQEDSYVPSDDDLQDSESVDHDSVSHEIVENEFEDEIQDRECLQKSPNPDIMEMTLEKDLYEDEQVHQQITNPKKPTLQEQEKVDHNEESQTDIDHSSDDDFQDILKMLDSTSFGNSKLVLSLKSAKLLEELELSLTGIEDDVDKLDEQEKEPETYSPSPLSKTPTPDYPVNKCLNDVEIVQVIESKPKPIETDSSRILKALRNTPGLSVSVTKKSRSPDSQMQETLSIAIPNWRLATKSERSFSESPESTVRIDTDERRTPIDPKKDEAPKKSLMQIVSSNEAQAKQVSRFEIDDPKNRSAVSPQPSGIPCSPILPRSSSAYLERLLPSPPCSVSCSEDAKNDLTLKGILSTPCLEPETIQKSNHQDDERPSIWKTPDIQPTLQNRLSNSQTDFLLTQQRNYLRYQHFRNTNQQWEAFVDATSTISDIPQSPATQLRQLLKTMGHLIPDPLLVPRHCLPGLAAAPSIEIPKLLTSRPELRLPEALNRPELLRDPDLLVISIAHLQYVLDQGQDSFASGGGIGRMGQQDYGGATMNCVNTMVKKTTNSGNIRVRPKLSCKPIGTLMPAPIDLSRSRKNGSSYSSLLRVRTGLLKQEPEVSSTGSNLEEHQLWHPLFSR